MTMKIERFETRVVELPTDNPLIVGQPVTGATRPFVTLELITNDGIRGLGLTFFGGPLTGALKEAVDALSALTIGADPLRPEAICDKLRRAGSGSGPSGIFTLALSAIDIALWDIKAKALGQPLCNLLGGHRQRVPTYASGALLRDTSIHYLAEAGPRLVARGFRQMKTQLGSEGRLTEALARIRILREGIGPDVDLMCDVNQRWDVNQTLTIGHQLEEFNLFWLEDVIAHDDYQGLARVADALTTPICAGEYHYGIRPFRHMLEARSIDIVMIDLARVGGITQWLKVAGMAEAFNIPVVSHLVPEISVHLIAAIPNGLTVEYMPWTLELFEKTPTIENGEILVPSEPGLGLAFDPKAMKRYGVN